MGAIVERFRRMAGPACAGVCLLLLAAASPARAAFAYVGDGANGGNLWQFRDLGGTLAPLTPPSADDGSASAPGLVVSPDSNSVYVTENGSMGLGTGVYEFDLNHDGTLTPKSTAMIGYDGALTTPTGQDLAISRNGNSLYVSDASGLVWQFAIGAGGVLSEMSPANVPAGVAPGELAVSPDGKSLYALQRKAGGTTILQFSIGSNGLLKAKNPPSAPLPGANGGTGLAITPDGTSVYATGNNNQIYEFDVGTGGVLSAKSSPTVTAADPKIGALTISPDGQNLYAGAGQTSSCTTGGSEILHYQIGAGGQLAPLDSVAGAPAGSGERDLVVAADGASLYASESCSIGAGSGIRQFDVGAGGALTPKPTGFLATGPAATDIAFSPLRSFSLSVTLSGNGAGTVRIGDHLCAISCSQTYTEGTSVVLQATAVPGSAFAGWGGGACTGTLPCTVSVTDDEPVSATFVRLPTPPHCTLSASNSVLLTAPRNRHGKGRVGAITVGVRCDENASATVTGTITESGANRHKRTFDLRKAARKVHAGTRQTLILPLPKPVLRRLGNGAKLSATLKLLASNANGLARTSRRIGGLKATRAVR